MELGLGRRHVPGHGLADVQDADARVPSLTSYFHPYLTVLGHRMLLRIGICVPPCVAELYSRWDGRMMNESGSLFIRLFCAGFDSCGVEAFDGAFAPLMLNEVKAVMGARP